jgi:glutathione S-transferase
MQKWARMATSAATLTISSKNYGSWSLRGWLMCKMSGLAFEERAIPADDPAARAELLLLSSSFLVPCLEHDGAKIWDTLAIGEYLAELKPRAGILPTERKARAHCRSVCGEMHSGFANLRAALPMNVKSRHPGYKVFAGAQPDIARILEIWRDCLETYGGPYLFGKPTMADAMYAPVCSRFRTYDVKLDKHSAAYVKTILTWKPMVDWIEAAMVEPEELDELDVEF